MTNIYKERQQEFDETFLTAHEGCDDGFYACPKSEDYFGNQDKLPISERSCYCSVENTKPKLLAFHQASMEAVAREIINEIPDEVDFSNPNMGKVHIKDQLRAKFLKDLTN